MEEGRVVTERTKMMRSGRVTSLSRTCRGGGGEKTIGDQEKEKVVGEKKWASAPDKNPRSTSGTWGVEMKNSNQGLSRQHDHPSQTAPWGRMVYQ